MHAARSSETHFDVWNWFEIEYGWTVETKIYNKVGNYPVPLLEGDRVLELWKLPDIV